MDKKTISNKPWNEWKHKTSLEIRAISSVEKAIKILFENVSKKEIYSIYIKGSFVRREMNEDSDVDIVPITHKNKTLDKIYKIQIEKGNDYVPSGLHPHSLEEFASGERYLKYNTPKGKVDLFLRDINRSMLIYGKPLDTKKFEIRTDWKFLNGQVKAFRETFLPMYEKKQLSFKEISKQIVHLVEKDERFNGREPPLAWIDLDKKIKAKNHIIHDAIKFRLKPVKDKKIEKKILKKLDQYIISLEKKLHKKVNK